MIKNLINTYLLSGHKRSVKAKKNILASFVIRGLNIATGLILIPLTIGYINPTKYGIWLTLSSIMQWFGFFDIGLNSGFRNRFSEALAVGNKELARIYVSTTYAVLSIIAIFLIGVFAAINPFLDWPHLLNTGPELYSELQALIFFVFASFMFQFVLGLIKVIFLADQNTALGHLIELFGKILSLILIFILIKYTHESLLLLGLSFSFSPLVIMIIASFIFFNSKYKEYSPSFKFVEFKYMKNIMNLGLKFFVIQIAMIVMFSTDNVIISQLYTPAQVTPYNISYKYFTVITMVFTIIVSPLWSAYTEAWVKHDYGWIKNTIKKLKIIWVLFALGIIVMIFVSPLAYKLLTGGTSVVIPFFLTICMAMYVAIRAYGDIYVNFINGTGKVKLQFYSAIIAALLNIPLCIFFAKNLNLGISGIILATLICISFGPVLAPIQYKKLINGTATGIWNK
jgi:O-antigen/teichoic acid export membrane protein